MSAGRLVIDPLAGNATAEREAKAEQKAIDGAQRRAERTRARLLPLAYAMGERLGMGAAFGAGATLDQYRALRDQYRDKTVRAER